MEKIKEFWKEHKYFRKGILIGFIVGFIAAILLISTSMGWPKFLSYLAFIPLYFIYPIIEDVTVGFGEGHALMVMVISLFILILFYLFVGGVIGFIVDKIKK